VVAEPRAVIGLPAAAIAERGRVFAERHRLRGVEWWSTPRGGARTLTSRAS